MRLKTIIKRQDLEISYPMRLKTIIKRQDLEIQMNQPQQIAARQDWQLKSRSIYIHVPIFKMKLYQPSYSANPYLFFHLPQVKKVLAYTPDLKTLLKTYRFPQDPHAFQIMNITPQDDSPHPYIVAGSTSGTIMCQSLAPLHIQQDESTGNDIFCINTTDKDPRQNYINEVLSLGNNKIVNCFNNGNIAFWDLSQPKRVHTIPKLHDSYTYKLRTIDTTLISCGHDGMTVATDLIKARPFAFLRNADSCWCSVPLNNEVVAAVGLFNRVNIWDLRSRRLMQCAGLENRESSFVTVFDENNLVLGDGPELKKCDLRTMRCRQFASERMLMSAESIIVTQSGGYACGRRFEVNNFVSVQVANREVPLSNKIYNPFTEGEMFMYETVFNQNREEVEVEENQEQEEQQEWEDQVMQDQEEGEEMVMIENEEELVELGQEQMAYRDLVEERDQQAWLIENNGETPVSGEAQSMEMQKPEPVVASSQQKQETLLQQKIEQPGKQQSFDSVDDSSSSNSQLDS